MVDPVRSNNPIQLSTQNIFNKSFDSSFELVQVEMMSYDPSSGKMKSVTYDGLNNYGTNDIDKSSTTLFYEGLEDAEGSWQMVKTTISGAVTSIRYATILNNPTVTNYSDAWTGRAGLTYETYGSAF